MIEVRLGKEEDYKPLMKIFNQYQREIGRVWINEWNEGLKNNWVYILLQDNIVIGGLIFKKLKRCPQKIVLLHIGIRRDLCGKKYGDLLINQLYQEKKDIVVRGIEENKNAVSFYLRHNFKIVKQKLSKSQTPILEFLRLNNEI